MKTNPIEQCTSLFIQWLRNNKRSAVVDKHVPNAEETRKLLRSYSK